jgi:tetratricopeptide (TPR) repeat protein
MKKLNLELDIDIGKNLTNNKEAYQLFLKGRSLADTDTKQNLELSIILFQKAIDLDTSYAEAYAEMAYSYLLMADNGYLKYDEVKDTINDLVKKSLDINPNIAKAYTVKGLLAFEYYSWESVEENFKKAIELNPNDAIAHHRYAMYFWSGPVQDVENFLKHLRIANQLDPLAIWINHWLFMSLIYNYKVIEAEELNNRSGFLIPSKEHEILRLSRLKAIKNKDWTEAIKLYEEELKKDPKNTSFLFRLNFLYNSVLVEREKALKLAREAYALDSTNNGITRWVFQSLILTKNIKEANEMLKGDNIDDDTRNHFMWFEELYRDKPDKIMDYHYKLKNPADKILTFAKLGDINSVNELRTKNQINSRVMAEVFANLKERDSMYYYMNKIPRNIDALNLNMDPVFDPYRKEERYKAFLKKNYLPLTHWNE